MYLACSQIVAIGALRTVPVAQGEQKYDFKRLIHEWRPEKQEGKVMPSWFFKELGSERRESSSTRNLEGIFLYSFCYH